MVKKMTDREAATALLEKHGKAGLARAAGLKHRQSADRWTEAIPMKYAKRIAESLGIPKSKVLPSQFSD
jgi:lambda repressor-like predicted transcriptional regulator